MTEPFPKEERDALVARCREVWARLFPADGPPPDPPERSRLRERYYQGLAEYALILALIAIVAILALLFLGTQISSILSYIGANI